MAPHGASEGRQCARGEEVDGTCRPDILLGDEIMINVRKLRVLQRKGDAMERQKVVEKTRKYLGSVGDRIKAVATQERTRRQIWQVGRCKLPCYSSTAEVAHLEHHSKSIHHSLSLCESADMSNAGNTWVSLWQIHVSPHEAPQI